MSPRASKNASNEAGQMETRDKIISLAYSAFAKNGYSRTSLKTISEELGITRPALYYHFDSKEDLFIAVYESIETISRASIEPTLASTDRESFETAFKEYFLEIFSGMRSDDERARFVSASEAASTEIPALRERVHANASAMFESIEKMIEHGIEIGVIHSTASKETLAKYLSLIVYGTSEATLRGETPDWSTMWPVVSQPLFDDTRK